MTPSAVAAGAPPTASAPPAPAVIARRFARRHRQLRVVLHIGPPLCQLGIDLAHFGAQQQEIIGGAKASMRHEAGGLLAAALAKAWLQLPDLAHGNGEASGNRHMLRLLPDNLALGNGQCSVGGMLLVLLQTAACGTYGRPQQSSIDESGRRRARQRPARSGVG